MTNAKPTKLFKSERCDYREFGVYADGQSFAEKHPALLEAIKSQTLEQLTAKDNPLADELGHAVRKLPEYLSFLKTTLKADFFFAAFSQSEPNPHAPEGKRTGQKDVENFVLERIKNQYSEPRQNYEFVVETGNKVIGYVELFDPKPCEHGLQYERGVFITGGEQGGGYGKEAIIALTDFAFKHLGIGRIFTMVDPENERSRNNILHNSGGVHFGEEESKYYHLDGGGKTRHQFHIYPAKFYAAVESKGNQKYLAQPHDDGADTPSANSVMLPKSPRKLGPT